MFSGFVGMCGHISVPVSACRSISGCPERRAGLYEM